MTLKDLKKIDFKKSMEEETKILFKPVNFTTRFLVTIGVLVVYCILLIVPLDEPIDPFRFMRMLLRTISRSKEITIGELGILPLMTTGIIMYLLVGVKVIKVNTNSQQMRYQYNKIKFLLSILMTIGMSAYLIFSWYQGYEMDLVWQLGAISQLAIAGYLIVILNEVINRGWGLGSGISIFIAGSISLRIIQGLFSPTHILEGSSDVLSAKGIVPAFLYWVGEEGPLRAFGNLFFRYSTNLTHNLDLPSLSIFSMILAGGVFCLIVILENKYSRINKREQVEQSKDSSLTPVLALILTTAIFAVVRAISQYVWNTGGRENYTSGLVHILGQYQLDLRIEQYVPVGGLVYFITPPLGLLSDLFTNPIIALLQALVYSVLFIGVYMSIITIIFRTNGFKLESVQINGNISRWLLIGVLAVITNLLNPLGIGLGIILLALTLVSYNQLIEGRGSPKFVRFDLESPAPLDTDESKWKKVVKNHYWTIISLTGLFLLFVWFSVSVILGLEM